MSVVPCVIQIVPRVVRPVGVLSHTGLEVGARVLLILTPPSLISSFWTGAVEPVPMPTLPEPVIRILSDRDMEPEGVVSKVK